MVSLTCLAAPLNVPEVIPEKFSMPTVQLLVLNFGVTEQNLTKFLQDVQIWLLITMLKSKLWFSDPFRYAKVTNVDRRKIVGESRQKLSILTAKTLKLLDGSSPNSDTM